MRPIRFIPTIAEIRAEEAGGIQGLEPVISYWTEGAYSAAEWFDEVFASWGPAGFVMRRGEEVSGFAVYGPPKYLPRAGRYPLRPLDEDCALLAYLQGDPRTRRHLLARVMRDLRLRGFSGVEAIASDLGRSRHVSTAFLSESGWKPVRRGLGTGSPYTLMRADFGSIVEVGEFARELVGRVKLPVLKAPVPNHPSSVLADAAASVKAIRAQERRS
ncbi:MAG: hypothetical protein M3N18_05400 [Actinomycetota bacterium]|nr:hypothetical protein [Actinomycetota bacterium]